MPSWCRSFAALGMLAGLALVGPCRGAEPEGALVARPIATEDSAAPDSLARDPRFDLPVTALGPLVGLPPDRLVHVSGTVRSQRPGQSLSLQDGTGRVLVETRQSLPVAVGDRVDAIGYPALDGDLLVLRQGLFRRGGTVLRSVDQMRQVPEAEQRNRHPVELEVLVHYHDPEWKMLWGQFGGIDDFLEQGATPFPLKSGQRILIKGSAVPANGAVIDDPQFTLLAEGGSPAVLSTIGHIEETERFDKHLVLVEGCVDRQSMAGPGHLKFDLVVEGRPVLVRLPLPKGAAVPELEGARLRAKGVYSVTRDPTGGSPTIELWVAEVDDLAVLGWLDRDQRFDLPATPIERLAGAPASKLLRVVGTVRAQQPGKSLSIADATGMVTLLTAQTRPIPVGETVEVVGYPVLRGGEWSLREGLYRLKSAGGATAPAPLGTIRLAEKLRELRPEEAARRHPVQLTGVVTWANRGSDFIFVRDASGGACVIRPPNFTEPIATGMKVEVVGVSSAGRFTPEILATAVKTSVLLEVPEAKTVLLEQAITGIEEAEWVSLSGYLRAVGNDGPWSRLEVATRAGDFIALVPPDFRLAGLEGAVVRVRGVCNAVTNDKRQLTGVRLWVPSAEFVEVEEALPADPFLVQERSIESLRQFDSQKAFNRRVRVSGVVTHQVAGRLLHLQEGTEALVVLSQTTLTPVALGDRIEAVGFPGRENDRVTLREAVYRRLAPGAEPAPVVLPTLTPINSELEGILVRAEGTLLDVGAQENGIRLILQTEGLVFEALLDRAKGQLSMPWELGSRVALTGVFVTQFDEYRRPKTVQLQLRSPQDVRVLERPSWWTVRRVRLIAVLLAVGLLLGVGWVLALRRRVAAQTEQIREQLEKEKAARLEAAWLRTSKLESLGVLAGGIAHDFNNLLTVILGNLSLAKLDERCEPDTREGFVESERAAMRARDLTQQLLTFAKGGAPVRAPAVLSNIVREATEFGLHGSKVSSRFDFPADLWPADVDKGQVGQVVQNLVINARHAMPVGGVVCLTLRNEAIAQGGRPGLAPGRYLRLSVVDTGEGIAPEVLPRIFEPYFTTKRQGSGLGLATVFSIIKQHHGHIEVESVLGEGTTMHVWLPAAEQAPEVISEPTAGLPLQTGRVLFMDDEAQIREMATAMLKRLGFAVMAVDDGSSVVLEYAAARDAGRPFDLVILDLTVPGGMGGAKAMERLRQMDPQVRAIVSSGYSSDPVLASYRAHGFSGIMPKPYVLGEVARVIDGVMRGPRA